MKIICDQRQRYAFRRQRHSDGAGETFGQKNQKRLQTRRQQDQPEHRQKGELETDLPEVVGIRR